MNDKSIYILIAFCITVYFFLKLALIILAICVGIGLIFLIVRIALKHRSNKNKKKIMLSVKNVNNSVNMSNDGMTVYEQNLRVIANNHHINHNYSKEKNTILKIIEVLESNGKDSKYWKERLRLCDENLKNRTQILQSSKKIESHNSSETSSHTNMSDADINELEYSLRIEANKYHVDGKYKKEKNIILQIIDIIELNGRDCEYWKKRLDHCNKKIDVKSSFAIDDLIAISQLSMDLEIDMEYNEAKYFEKYKKQYQKYFEKYKKQYQKDFEKIKNEKIKDITTTADYEKQTKQDKYNKPVANILESKNDSFEPVVIDKDKLSIVEEQTKEAQNLLSEIFEEETMTEVKAQDNNNDKILSILKILFEKESWSRSEVQNLCDKENMLLGAALEKINDYSYSKIDDSVIDEDGDKIYVSLEYKETLL